jgi:hypothetical protein
VIGDDAVSGVALDDEVRHIDVGAVDEAGSDVPIGVELGRDAQIARVEEALDDDSVDLLADAAVLGVDQVVDAVTGGEDDG